MPASALKLAPTDSTFSAISKLESPSHPFVITADSKCANPACSRFSLQLPARTKIRAAIMSAAGFSATSTTMPLFNTVRWIGGFCSKVVIYHLSFVTCRLSFVICHLSFVIRLLLMTNTSLRDAARTATLGDALAFAQYK